MSTRAIKLVREVPLLELDVDTYMAHKKLRLTASSRRGYLATLRTLARFYPKLTLSDFEPPNGTRLLEDFLVINWGDRAPRTYNKNLTVISDFFRWMVLRERMLRNPVLPIERAKPREIRRVVFSKEERARILAVNPAPRDQIALRLLLDYGLRKGSLLNVTFGCFNTRTRTIEFLMKGERYHTIPIPERDPIWTLLTEIDEPAHHYLLCRQIIRKRRPPERDEFIAAARAMQALYDAVEALTDESSQFELGWTKTSLETGANWFQLAAVAAGRQVVRSFPDQPLGVHPAHDWWYHCIARAGIVPLGVTRGRKMHGARHSAGQRILEATGNLKAAQVVLGHKNIATTGDSYTGWDEAHTRADLSRTVPDENLDADLLHQAAATASRAGSRSS